MLISSKSVGGLRAALNKITRDAKCQLSPIKHINFVKLVMSNKKNNLSPAISASVESTCNLEIQKAILKA